MKAEAIRLVPRKRIRASRPQFGSNSKPVNAKLPKLEPKQEENVSATVIDPNSESMADIKAEPMSDLKEEILTDPKVDSLAAHRVNPKVEIKSELDVNTSEDHLQKIEGSLQEPSSESLSDIAPRDWKSFIGGTPLDLFPDDGPPNWKLFIEKVREMRMLREAPVDTMGCERVGEKEGNVSPKVKRFQHLIALMLSSQTKDEVTAGAVSRLREYLKPTLTPESILSIPEQDLAQLILPVGFFRRKAVYVQKTAQILLDKYDGDIPQTIEEIIQLPGVGPKMGYLLLQSAWNQVHGIGVDVHVHRLAQLWRWVPATKSPTPEKTRLELEKWLPKELWAEINPLLVGFGQTWCPPRLSSKACSQCHLLNLCPSAQRK